MVGTGQRPQAALRGLEAAEGRASVAFSVIVTQPVGLAGWLIQGCSEDSGISPGLCPRGLGCLRPLPGHSGGPPLQMWGPGQPESWVRTWP